MDWATPTAVAFVGLVGIGLGHWLSQRATDRQWERSEQLRREEWQRDDSRRWDSERITAYSALWGESLELVKTVGDLAPYWERNEDPPREATYAFENQRDTVTAAHARAKLLASKDVRTTLRALWKKTLEIGTALDQPPDGSVTGDALVQRLGAELGWLLGDVDAAVAEELGVDAVLDD